MAIFVTGGAGYIGSHTCITLLQEGRDIVVMDNLSNAKPRAVELIREISGKDFPFYQADMLSVDDLENIFSQHSIDCVIHFAGLKAVGESVSKPMEYYHNNIAGTVNLCKVMAAHGCKRMVFSSSATVYGMHNPVPFREDMPLSATNPYGRTKLFIEEILRDIAKADPEWSVVSLRYFNPIGAHESGLLGEDPNGIPNNLFPYISQVAVGKLEHLHIYGEDYDTPDGTGVRDYIHVVDLALGHLRAVDYCMVHTGATEINLGTGKGSSVWELFHTFERVCGKSLPYVVDPRRPGDVATCYADTAKAKELLGWESRLTLEDMCRDGWRFIKKNPSGL